MVDADEMRLDSKVVGALPIINHFIKLLEIDRLFDKYLPSRNNMKLSHQSTLELLLRDILIEREPLYEVAEWASRHEATMVGLGNNDATILNDDRLGRGLDELFLADRATMMTELVLNVVKKFDVELSQLHNDSTSITVTGKYKARTQLKGKPSIKLKHGVNKDHRPDLKQLLFTLTVSRDGAVPIHYKAYDGNVTDNSTHIQTWEALRRIAGRTDFAYVADCKLCTREQMDYINKEGGRFVTVMPRTRAEDKWFRNWLKQNHVEWQELRRKKKHEYPSDEDDIYWGFESPIPSAEGYRIIWVLSNQKQKQDEQNRQSKIQRTISELDKIKSKIGRRRLKTKEQITESVKKIFTENDSSDFFEWSVICHEKDDYKQRGKGRPGKNTKYEKCTKSMWTFEALPNDQKIQDAAADDGVFPLITNYPASTIPMNEILAVYKYQPYLEKRHEQLKTVFDAMPVWLKLPYRIEALMFLYFVALVINALIERQTRLSMKKRGIKSLPLYPERRICRMPATERIIGIFKQVRKNVLYIDHKAIKTFKDPLGELHKTVLNLLGVPRSSYE